MTDTLSLTIGPISEDDDLTVDFQASLNRQREFEIDQGLEALLEKPAPVAGSSASGIAPDAPAEALSVVDDQQLANDRPEPSSYVSVEPGATVLDALSSAGAAVADVGHGIVEAPAQILGGAVDALGELGNTMESLLPAGGVQITDPETGEFDLKYLGSDEFKNQFSDQENTLFDAISPDDADSVTGGLVRSTAQFLTAFMPAAKGLKAAGVTGAFVNSMTAGAVADVVAFDPHEGRLSTYLNEVPALAGIVPDYLAENDPAKESEFEGRLKNAIEGAGLGLATEALVRTFKYYKIMRRQKSAAKIAQTPEAELQAAVGRDTIRDAARAELVDPISSDDLAGLGTSEGDFFFDVPAGADPVDTVRRRGMVTDAVRTIEAQRVVLVDALENVDLESEFGKAKATKIKTRIARLETLAAKHLTPENIEKVSRAIGNVDDAAKRVNDDAAGDVIAAITKDLQKEGIDPLQEIIDLARKGPGADPAAKMAKRPALNILKQSGGVEPGSPLAGELNALGVTQKTAPGLFRKGGITDADNLVASEHAAFSDLGGPDGYIPQDTLLDAIREEMAGNPNRTPEEMLLIDAYQAASDAGDDARRAFEEMGIDVDTMDLASIKARLEDIEIEKGRLNELDELEAVDLDEPVQLSMNEADAAGVPDLGGGTNPQPTGKVFINHARINTADDVRGLLQQMADADADAINLKTRGTVSNAQTLKESKKEFQDLNDLIGRAPGPMSAAEAVAARKVLTASGEQVANLAKRAAAPDALQADIFALHRAMSVHYAIQSEVVAARTETARALQSWAIPAGSDKLRADAIEQMITDHGGSGDLRKMAMAISSLSDNPTGLNVAIRESVASKFKKAAFQIWINGLLSSPKTHAVNILSNSLTAVWAIPERYLAAGISNVFQHGEIDAGEVSAMAYGMVKGIRDGFKLIATGNKGEIGDVADLFEMFSKVENHTPAISGSAFGIDDASALGRGISYAGKVINVPGTLLGIEDAFFKSVAYRQQLHSLSYRRALGEGLEGEAMASRMIDIMQSPPKDLVTDAMDFASVQTFTNNLGPIGKSIQEAVRKIPGARIVLPFIRTPTNVMKFAFVRTPLAPFAASVRADIRAGGPRGAQALARISMGSMLMATIADMTTEGSVTGGGPLDPRLKRMKLGTGWKPYSVNINDRWYQYSRTDPIGMVMGMSADIAEILANVDEEEGGMVVTAGAVALASNLASKTYLSGLFDFMAAIDKNNPTSDPSRYISKQAGTLVPYSSFLRNIAVTADPLLRETRTSAADPMAQEYFSGLPDPVAEYMAELINAQKSRLPGMSKGMPPRRDLWGQPISRESGLGWGYDLISPIASSADKPDKVTSAILDNGIKISAPPRAINGVKLTAKEYSDFVEMAGKPAKEYLDEFVTSPGFDALSDGPDGMKAELLKDIINNFRDIARVQMVAENDDLRRRVHDAQIKKQQIKTGAN